MSVTIKIIDRRRKAKAIIPTTPALHLRLKEQFRRVCGNTVRAMAPGCLL